MTLPLDSHWTVVSYLDVLDKVFFNVVDEIVAGESFCNAFSHFGVRNHQWQHTGNVGQNSCKKTTFLCQQIPIYMSTNPRFSCQQTPAKNHVFICQQVQVFRMAAPPNPIVEYAYLAIP